MTTAKLRAGLVGVGWVATDRYLPTLKRLDDVSLIGVVDRNVDNARRKASRFDTQPFGDVEDLMDQDLDILFVCTPPFSHASIAETALRGGTHVFVEKPMAVSIGDAQRMVDTAAEMNMKLGVSHNLLFSRSVSAARRKLESGEVGQIVHIQALQASSPRRRLPTWYPDLPGGLVFDEVPHMIYLLDWLTGGLIVRDTWSRQAENSNQVRALGVDMVGRDGLHAGLTMLFDAPVSEWLISITCAQGVIVLDLFRDIEFTIPPDGSHRPREIVRTSLSGIVGHLAGTFNTGVRYLSKRQFWGHDVIVRDFVSSVKEDRMPAVRGEDGLRVVQVIEDILGHIE